MKSSHIALLALAAFAGGLSVGYIAGPGESPRTSADPGLTVRTNQTADASHAHEAADATKPQGSEASDADAAKTKDLQGAIRAALAEPNPLKRGKRLNRIGEMIDPRDARDALAFVETLSRNDEKERITNEILSTWAETNPREALDYALAIPATRGRSNAVAAVVSSWSANDAAASEQWVAGLPAGNLKNQLSQVLAYQLARTDPDRAIALMQSTSSRRYGGAYSVFSQLAATDPAAAAGRAMRLSGDTRQQAMQTVGRVWINQDPQAALAWIRQLPEGRDRDLTLINAVSALAQTDPVAAADLAVSLPPGQSRNNLIGQVAQQWAGTDIKAALAWVQEFPADAAREQAFSSVTQEWAQADPKGAAQFALTMKPGDQRNQALSSAVSNWANVDFDSALAWLGQLPDGASKANIIQSMSYQVASQDPQRGISLVELMPAGETQDRVLENVSAQWAQSDPAGAAAWAAQQVDAHVKKIVWPAVMGGLAASDPKAAVALLDKLPAADRDGAIPSIAYQWSSQDPRAAATWVFQLPDGVTKQSVLSNVASNWSRSDPEAAGSWLKTMPSGQARDGALRGFANQLSQNDPPAAVQWLALISDEKTRTSQTEQIVRNWLRRDENAARTWIQSSNLSNEVKTKLLAPK